MLCGTDEAAVFDEVSHDCDCDTVESGWGVVGEAMLPALITLILSRAASASATFPRRRL